MRQAVDIDGIYIMEYHGTTSRLLGDDSDVTEIGTPYSFVWLLMAVVPNSVS